LDLFWPGSRHMLVGALGRVSGRLSGLVWSTVSVLVACSCSGGEGSPQQLLPPNDPAEIFFARDLSIDLDDFERTSSGLYIQDLSEGAGTVARRTSRVWIEYVGWLPDGTVFDGNVGGTPYAIRLGGNEVIRGWNQGIVGMRRGGIRRLVVRPGLAYGSSRRGDIPPGSTLIFHIKLIDVD
jgi:FKBP-type peptidyl-prolyl cis-trans isomerase FkpA